MQIKWTVNDTSRAGDTAAPSQSFCCSDIEILDRCLDGRAGLSTASFPEGKTSRFELKCFSFSCFIQQESLQRANSHEIFGSCFMQDALLDKTWARTGSLRITRPATELLHPLQVCLNNFPKMCTLFIYIDIHAFGGFLLYWQFFVAEAWSRADPVATFPGLNIYQYLNEA